MGRLGSGEGCMGRAGVRGRRCRFRCGSSDTFHRTEICLKQVQLQDDL